jgi:hypothetical protein
MFNVECFSTINRRQAMSDALLSARNLAKNYVVGRRTLEALRYE